MNKIFTGFAIGAIALGASAFFYIEQEKDKLINSKIQDFKSNFQVDLAFKDSSYNYFTDKLVFSDVVIEDHNIEKITINNGRTQPLYVDIDVMGLKLPLSEVSSLLLLSGFPEKKLELISYLSRNSDFFTINGSIKDLLDKKNGIVSTALSVDIENVLKLKSDINMSNIPTSLLDPTNPFLEMNNNKIQDILNISVNPSHIKIDTTGLFLGFRSYLTEIELGSHDKFIEVLDRGINTAKTSKKIPALLASNVVTGLESLKNGKEFSIQFKLDKTITLKKISQSIALFKTGTAKDIKDELFISLESKSI